MIRSAREHRSLRRVASLVVVLALGGASLAACSGSSDDTGDGAAAARAEPVAVGADDQAATSAGARERIEFGRRPHQTLAVHEGASVGVHDSPDGEQIGSLGDRTEWKSPTVLSVVEKRGGWAGFPTPLRPDGELGWVRLDPRVLEGGSTAWSLVVRLSQRSAQLKRGDHVVDEFAVNIGAPGSQTPTGRFAVTDTFIGDLNPSYGCCAVAISARQANVPSGWLGGDRIAIHGNPGTLPGADSAGCVRAEDEKVRELVYTLWPGAPVIIEA